jgi:hypothetical protein
LGSGSQSKDAAGSSLPPKGTTIFRPSARTLEQHDKLLLFGMGGRQRALKNAGIALSPPGHAALLKK